MAISCQFFFIVIFIRKLFLQKKSNKQNCIEIDPNVKNHERLKLAFY